ncbi:DNA-binding SARP family transcriptional activator [Kitasatospora sp. MAP12-15]|uniref:AfsR/SARP family transcriptional regulator n=1 Tax=unclassified Kitasatospora TaxID=2633591 RepID=UPI00247C3932|nr:DNA-binding SARP family transcriptional activator [Kitasatospora sp. MAP12-44]
MQFRILGSVGAVVDGRFCSIPGARQRTLLATLLIRAGRLVPTEHLYTELWGDRPPATVENSLQAHVCRLRRTLRKLGGPSHDVPPLITHASGYVLDIAPEDVDLTLFRERIALSRNAMADAPEAAGALLEEALALWQGSPLQDVAPGPLCQSVSLQLEEEYLAALEDKLWLGTVCDEPTLVIGELKRMSVAHPWRERITEMLMLALYRSGRQAEAVAVYNTARGRLIDELGMEPSPQLKRLFREVLNQAPGLYRPTQQLLRSA